MSTNDNNYELRETPGAAPVKAWTRGVEVGDEAWRQIGNVAKLPFIHGWVAVMPDAHWGIGATVGTVIPAVGAIVPAAVGVDIGCGMMATRTTLRASDLPDDLSELRSKIERAVPHGRTASGRRGDRGAWANVPAAQAAVWAELAPAFDRIASKHRAVRDGNTLNHLGTLGTGNHFIEVCLDESQQVWFLLHSGSRGVGNRIGTYFIELAKNDMRKQVGNLPDADGNGDLAYFTEGAQHFDDYVEAVSWAQTFARRNRELMMAAVVKAVSETKGIPPFATGEVVVNCHHNYVNRETHFGKEVWITRKGAVRAGLGELGIIPGSMGAKSFIVRGKGNKDSFETCSHGAGRSMSRAEAKRRFSIADHERAVEGVECRRDADVIDETPAAYKSIDAVMAAQADLVDVVHTLKQVVCVKG